MTIIPVLSNRSRLCGCNAVLSRSWCVHRIRIAPCAHVWYPHPAWGITRPTFSRANEHARPSLLYSRICQHTQARGSEVRLIHSRPEPLRIHTRPLRTIGPVWSIFAMRLHLPFGLSVLFSLVLLVSLSISSASCIHPNPMRWLK